MTCRASRTSALRSTTARPTSQRFPPGRTARASRSQRWLATTREMPRKGSALGWACLPGASNSCRACVLRSRKRRIPDSEVRHEAVLLGPGQDHARRSAGVPARPHLGAEAGAARRVLRACPYLPGLAPDGWSGALPDGLRWPYSGSSTCWFVTWPSCPLVSCPTQRAFPKPPLRFPPSLRAASRPSRAAAAAHPSSSRTCR